MKRFLLWSLLAVIVLVAIVLLAFRFSPLPSAYLIRYIFASDSAAQLEAIAAHVPDGVAAQYDLSYGDGPDEKFDLFFPEGTDQPLPTIIWVHGGAWLAGSKDGVASYLQILASHGITTIGIDYTLAPTELYPTPVRQTNAAFAHLVANADAYNIDPDRLVVGGDSAGAQIAAQFANIVTSPDYARNVDIAPSIAPDQLVATLLASGAYQLDTIDPDGDFGWFLRTVLWTYSGVRDFMNDPQFTYASVTNFVTADFPSTFVTGGNGDPLTAQGKRLAATLEQQGVMVETLFFPQDHEPAQPHEYQFNLDSPEGQQALARTIGFLDRVLER